MCGIVGVFGESSNLNLGKSISLMTQTLTHRGPDDSGTLQLRLENIFLYSTLR